MRTPHSTSPRGHGEILTLILLALVIGIGFYIHSIYSNGECIHVDLSNGGSCNTSLIYTKLPGQSCPPAMTGFGSTAPCASIPGNVTSASTTSDSLPTIVGTCNQTTITSITLPPQNSLSTQSTVTYSNGGQQTTNNIVAGINDSQVGDDVNLCLVSYPAGCVQGDTRGTVYSATNLRTFEHWQAPNSLDACVPAS